MHSLKLIFIQIVCKHSLEVILIQIFHLWKIGWIFFLCVVKNEEFETAVNGPGIAHCESVVNEALKLYFKEKDSTWKFFKTLIAEKLKNFEYDS